MTEEVKEPAEVRVAPPTDAPLIGVVPPPASTIELGEVRKALDSFSMQQGTVSNQTVAQTEEAPPTDFNG